MLGKNVDGAFAGSPISLLTLQAIAAGNLKQSDVKYVTREADVGQQLAALVNKAVDVQGTTEPTATSMQLKRLRREVALVSRRDPVVSGRLLGRLGGVRQRPSRRRREVLQAYLKGEMDFAKTKGS